MRIGSLFSGAGGLDMAVEQVFNARTVWHCENDPAASKVLAYRWPGVPNHRDITAVDWPAVEPVDILCGGFPCQDVSAAGRRAGLADGTRTGLWARFADAIAALRPRYVIAENVRGLLNAAAHRPMESEPNALGDGNSEPVLRAIGAVLGDLADLGYDAQWVTVSAASVGAPHRRERVFILATDTQCRAGGASPRLWARSRAEEGARTCCVAGRCGMLSAHSEGIGRGVRNAENQRPAYREVDTSTDDRDLAADTCGDRRGRHPQRNSQSVGPELEASQRRNPDGRSDTAADPTGIGRDRCSRSHTQPHSRGERPRRGDTDGRSDVAPHSPRDGRHEGRPEPARLVRGSDAALSGDGPRIDALLPTPRAQDANGYQQNPEADIGNNGRTVSLADRVTRLGGDGPVDLLPTPNAQDGNGGKQRSHEALARGDRQTNLTDLPRLLPTPTSRDHKGRNQRDDDTCLPGALLPTPRSSDCFGAGLHGDGGMDLRTTVSLLPTPMAHDAKGTGPSGFDRNTPELSRIDHYYQDTQWGKYGAAIARWETLTRPAPSPTEPNRNGNPRLAAAFSEWMMGWPAGWVTQVPGVSRNDALRIVGNGVCPQQATAALRWLLNVAEVAA